MRRSLLAIAAWVFLQGAEASAEAGGVAARLPADTAYFASVRDVARLGARARKGPLGALWADPALADLVRRVEERFAGRPGDTTPLELFRLVRGEIAVAGLRGRAAVGFVDCGPRTLPFRSLLELYFRQQARDRSVTEEAVRASGRTILVRRRGGAVQAHVWLDTHVCFAESVDALRAVARHWTDRPARSLADRPAFREARTGDEDLFVWADPGFWLDRLGLDPARVEAFGLDGVDGLAASLTLREHGVVTEIRVLTRGERRGLLRLLDRPRPGLGPPPFLPADCGAFLTASVDYPALAAGALRFDPGLGARLATDVRTLRRATGIDVAPLLHALGDEVTLAYLPPRWARSAGSDSVADPRAPWGDLAVIQEVDHPGAVARFLDQLDRATGGLPRLDVDGVTVRVLPGERMGYVAELPGHVVVASSAGAVRALVRARTSRRDTDAYRRAAARAPRDRTLFALLDPHARSGPSLRWLALRAARPDLLPLLDALDPYRDAASFHLASDDRGLRFTWTAGVRAAPARAR